MKYVLLVLFAIFGLCAVPDCSAEEGGDKTVAEEKTSSESESEENMKPIDLGDEGERRADEGGCGVDNPQMMPPGDDVDENTGAPNIVESDTTGEIE
ncbi:MAG: hypothetical protein WC592_05595 [Candidatus Omnitrophota bacterium]|nr:hypothetical protein [Candidatus Omnitrophota bacterium]